MQGTKKLHELLKRIADLESELITELDKLDNESPMRWDPRWYDARSNVRQGIRELVRIYEVELEK